MLPWSWAVERLAGSRNYWICTARPDGRPHAAPVWGAWLDDAVLFGTNPASVKGRNLARDPALVVHLESGDEVVILEGNAEAAAVDERAADVFHAKYDWRPEPEGDAAWYRLAPSVAYAWLEADYPRTATRFDFAA